MDGKPNNSLWSSNNILKKHCTSGLHNLGNTCFMNSILQCLAHTGPLLDYCLPKNYLVDINYTGSSMKGSVIKAFANLVQHMWKNDEPVSPQELKGQIQKFSPPFTGYNQHDAQEFLHFLLEGLHNDVNRVKNKPTPLEINIDDNLNDNDKAIESWKHYLRFDNSRIVDIFVGQLKNTLKCTVCGYTSVTFDPFWDLSLPIPKSCGRVTLQECLTLFTKEETLDGEEKPTCSRCKAKRKCIKKLMVHKFPQILLLHLKRFSQCGSFRDKLHTTVEYPLGGLDMIPYATQLARGRANYNLYAVVHHSGSPFSGHYTASCCHPDTHRWYRYNDENAIAISSDEVTLSEGYVLFYELGSQSSRL
ncbi:ubiquitin carboxyl-terminal hydrolase 2-like isoform X2 [Centruroides vittatus]|uniref:ubiquitin carboxyl-terminal hydrolase 2-like isoform X2 n=1 Tax=Centruroides vittatus TaxID=120091 RepID=UPI0035107ABC